MESDRDWSIIPVETAAKSGVPGLWSRAGGRIYDQKIQGQNRVDWGGQGQLQTPPPPAPREGSHLSSFLPGGAHAPPVPSGRKPGGGDQLDQPKVSLFTSPRAICHCYTGGGKPALTLLP